MCTVQCAGVLNSRAALPVTHHARKDMKRVKEKTSRYEHYDVMKVFRQQYIGIPYHRYKIFVFHIKMLYVLYTKWNEKCSISLSNNNRKHKSQPSLYYIISNSYWMFLSDWFGRHRTRWPHCYSTFSRSPPNLFWKGADLLVANFMEAGARN